MDVLVTGGTGFVGSHLCAALDRRGHDVTAFSRSPGGADVPEGVDLASGDVTEVESIAAATEGRDAVVNTVALTPLRRPRGGEERHDVVHRGGTQNCVAAAEAADVHRFVQVSGIHADPDGPTAYLRAKGRAEAIVREADVEHVVVRPTTVFGDGDEITPFVRRVAPPYLTPLPGGGRQRFQLIWVADLAEILAEAVDGADHAGDTYEIGGPDVLTLAEIARLIHRSDGRPATVVPVPMALAGVGMTLGQYVPGFPFGPDQYRSLRMDLVCGLDDLAAFDVDPDGMWTYEDYLGVEPARA